MAKIKTVLFVAGIMDMLHEGHINLLKTMRSQASKVVVILHDDRSCYLIKNKIPIQNLKQRKQNLKITGLVDEVRVTRKTDPSDQFKKVWQKYGDDVLIYVRGDDMTTGFPGEWFLKEKHIPIVFKPYTKGVSSTKRRDEL